MDRNIKTKIFIVAKYFCFTLLIIIVWYSYCFWIYESKCGKYGNICMYNKLKTISALSDYVLESHTTPTNFQDAASEDFEDIFLYCPEGDRGITNYYSIGFFPINPKAIDCIIKCEKHKQLIFTSNQQIHMLGYFFSPNIYSIIAIPHYIRVCDKELDIFKQYCKQYDIKWHTIESCSQKIK